MNSTNKTAEEEPTLICWIGDTDLLVLGKEGAPAQRATAKKVWMSDKGVDFDFDKEVEKLDLATRNSSIVLTLQDNPGIPAFSKIILLTNRPDSNTSLFDDFKNHFKSYLCKKFPRLIEAEGGSVSVEFVSGNQNSSKGVDAWNYAAVYEATKKVLERHMKNGSSPDARWLNITPGTIAQSTSLILLGKERDSNFLQVEKSRSRVDHCAIPFDVSAMIGQRLMRAERDIASASGVVGDAPCFLKALGKARKVARYPVSVLITGPSGTGKEVFAREIHRISGRDSGKFVAINCAMLSKETGITELTGYFEGAYTGADDTTPGKFHEADGGTLFLDEVGDCPPDVQAELLRFLQPLKSRKPTEREWRLKGAEPVDLPKDKRKYSGVQSGDIRVIAATNKNLRDTSLFREDLYFRLETIQIRLPSLEERKAEADATRGIDDLAALADFFLRECCAAFKMNKRLSPEAYTALRAHIWTGNVRELQNVVTRLVLLSSGDTITASDVADNLDAAEQEPSRPVPASADAATATAAEHAETPLAPSGEALLAEAAKSLARADVADGGKTHADRVKEFSREYCKAALDATRGSKKAAYEKIGLAPKTFGKFIS